MAEIATAYVSLIPSASKLGKGIETELGDAGDRGGKSAGKRAASSLSKWLKRGVVATGVAAGGLLATALVKGWGRLTNIENATAKLSGLGNSAKTVDSIMDNALASVKGTAFGLDEAATTAAGAVAAGIKPGKELEGVLKTVADTATIAGKSMADTGAIFGSVAARGKLQGDDLMQLQSAGVPVLAMLAKHYKITAAEASKMVSAGEVDFKNFNAALSENLGGAALKSGETTQGAFKNMGAALGRFGAALAGPAFDNAQKFFVGVTGWIDSLTSKVGPFVDAFSKKFGAAMKALPRAWDAVKTKWDSVFGAGSGSVWDLFHSGITMNAADREKFAGTLADDKWMSYGASVRAGMETALSAAKSGWSKLTDRAKAASPKVRGWLVDAFSLPPSAASSWSGFGKGVLGKAAAAAQNFGKQAWDGIGKFLEAARPGFKKLWDAVQPIITEFGPKIRDVLTAFNPFTAAFRILEPILPKVAELVGGLASSIGTLLSGAMKGLKPIVEAVAGAIQRLIPFITDLVASLMPALAGLVTKLQPLFESLAPVLEGVGKAIGKMIQVAEPLIKGLLTVVRDVIGAIIKVLGGVIDFLTGIFTGDWKKVWSGVKQIFTGIWDAIKAFLKPLWAGIKKAAQVAWDGIKAVIITPLKAVKDWLSSVFGTIKGWFSNLWNGIKSGVKIIWGAFYAVYIAPLEKAYGYVTGTFGKVKGWFSNLWSGIKSTASDIWGGIQLTITRPLSRAYKWVKETFGKIKGWFADLWNGIVDKASSILGGLKGAATSAFSGLKDIIKTPINGIIRMINSTAIWGINKLIDGANKIPFVDIPHLSPIPTLARGGVVSEPTLAVVGDAGRGNPEIVAPERMIRRIIQEEVRARHGVDERRPVSSPVFNITEARANPSEIAAEVNRRLAFVGA